MPRGTASSSLPCRRASAAGSMSLCRWAFWMHFDQRVFEGLEGPGGRDRPGGVMLLLAHVGNFD
jgi:hypothetical protein